MSKGTVYGVGLGPGDPDLMSVRADRLVRGAKNVAYFRKAGRKGQARRIVDGLLREDVVEYPMEYPVTTEIPLADPRYNETLSCFYQSCVADLQKLIGTGEDVIVLCEGDPFFYGSFMHLYERLKASEQVKVVPAITGMSAAWTATGMPVTWGDDVLTVAMGTLPEAELTRRIQDTDALIIMKIGRNFPKVRQAIDVAGRLSEAWLVEFAAMAEQNVVRLADAGDRVTPYFSIIVIHGKGRRP